MVINKDLLLIGVILIILLCMILMISEDFNSEIISEEPKCKYYFILYNDDTRTNK